MRLQSPSIEGYSGDHFQNPPFRESASWPKITILDECIDNQLKYRTSPEGAGNLFGTSLGYKEHEAKGADSTHGLVCS